MFEKMTTTSGNDISDKGTYLDHQATR
jgi:hypothetical protein